MAWPFRWSLFLRHVQRLSRATIRTVTTLWEMSEFPLGSLPRQVFDQSQQRRLLSTVLWCCLFSYLNSNGSKISVKLWTGNPLKMTSFFMLTKSVVEFWIGNPANLKSLYKISALHVCMWSGLTQYFVQFIKERDLLRNELMFLTGRQTLKPYLCSCPGRLGRSTACLRGHARKPSHLKEFFDMTWTCGADRLFSTFLRLQSPNVPQRLKTPPLTSCLVRRGATDYSPCLTPQTVPSVFVVSHSAFCLWGSVCFGFFAFWLPLLLFPMNHWCLMNHAPFNPLLFHLIVISVAQLCFCFLSVFHWITFELASFDMSAPAQCFHSSNTVCHGALLYDWL